MYTRIKSCVAMNQFRHLILASLLLAGCAQTSEPARLIPPEKGVSAYPVAVEKTVLPDIKLSDELLYEMLLTEFAEQRGHNALAVDASEDVAQKTRDPRLVKRAAQLVLESGDMDRAVAAFRLWQAVEPNAMMATRMLSQLLLRGGKLSEARPNLLKVLESDPLNAGITFLQLYPLVAYQSDKPAALKLMRDLAKPYPAVSEAHWVVAQLALSIGDEKLALSEVRVSHKLKPQWDSPIALEAQLLHEAEPQQSLSLLSDYLSKHPKAHAIRLQYARELLAQKQYKAARGEFQYLVHEGPDNVKLAFAVALISLQLKDTPGVEAEFKQSLIKDGKGADEVAYYLGQLNEAKEDEAQALNYYRQVRKGKYVYSAQLRQVYLLSKLGQLSAAQHCLHKIKANTRAQHAQLVVVDAQLLRKAKQDKRAYRALQQGLLKQPNNSELLYETAMQADKLEHYQVAEKLLRKLIEIKPDDAQAYNALGYGFLERNVRIAEAVKLVEHALQLSPKDYSIMDSVGWGYYRSGKLNESVAMLRRALLGNPDPEIAAHLGEVLWTRGDKQEATQLLRGAFKDHPDNKQLKVLIKRFSL